MKSKKSDSQAYLVILILALALIIVFTSIYSYIKTRMSQGTISQIRIENVRRHANAHIAGVDLSSELNFPIIKMQVKERDILKDSSRALVEDWRDLLEGKRELFPAKTDKIVYCVPGHYIEFKEKKKQISLKELAKYQREHKVGETGAAGIGDKSNMFINKYLTGYATDKTVFEEEMNQLKEELKKEGQYVIDESQFFAEGENLNQQYSINTNNDYTTVFVYMKKGYWMKWMTSTFGTVVGTVGGIILVPFTGGGSLVFALLSVGGGLTGGVIGYMAGSDKSADWSAGIFLVPNKENILKDLKCDILPARGE